MSRDRVLLGVVAAPHGVRGLVRIKSFTEDPMAVAAYGPLSDESGKKEYRVEALSAARGAVLARIEGVADRTAAEALRGIAALRGAQRLPATGEREWYEADLIGLEAVGTDGRDWGKVIAFHDFGAGSVMEVSGGRSMLPFTDEAVPEIDVEGGKVLVDPPAGLLAGGGAKEARADVWRATALTLFPEMFPGPLGESLAGKALKEGTWALEAVDIRRFAKDRHGTVDDAPFGGGAGMVMKPDVLSDAIAAVSTPEWRGAEAVDVAARCAVQSGAGAGAGEGTGCAAGLRPVRGRRRAGDRGARVGRGFGRRFRALGRRDRGHGGDG